MNFRPFLIECRDKQIFKKLSIFIVSSWVALQALAITWEPLGLPEKSVTYLIITLLAIFPIYTLFIWKYRISKSEKEQLDEDELKKKQNQFQKLFYSSLSIITLLCALFIVFIVNNKFLTKLQLPVFEKSDKIAVLKFGNNTGNSEFDIIGKMAADWIVHGITENQVAQVVSPEIVSDYLSILNAQATSEDNETILQDYFKPSKIISGNFYLEGNTLILQCAIAGENINETIIAFKNNECDKDKPLDCIEELKQRIIGYLITKDHPKLNLQQTPPKYKAYQNVLNAKANFSNEAMYIDLLNKAIAIDSNYFEPKVLRIAYYYGLGEYKKADSLRKAIRPSSFNNTRQRNLLNHYEALIHGKNDKIYSTIKKEYDFAPFDIQTNSTFMTVALQFVNRPKELDSIYNEVTMEGLDLLNCAFCPYRIYSKALADIELKKYDDVITALKPAIEIIEDTYLKKPLVTAYIRSNKSAEVNTFIDLLKLELPLEDWQNMCLFAGNEYVLLNEKSKADEYFEKIIHSSPLESNSYTLAKAYYMKEDFSNAQKIFKNLYQANPKNINFTTYLAISNYKLGHAQKAEDLILSLNDLRADYQYGNIDYAFAKYYASTENKEDMFKHLRKSLLDGHLYTSTSFQNDPHFKSYLKTKEFESVMNFWH
ncbi:tetratricopeptide repeat protein [Lacinutrix iliipiscaria]|uniref:Tetratricopeptide repeat protein n=1 Tax=Lacinutrix iliipiscaria TaxID=1230532 RepID=A0ABW5WNV6_9FLAO